MKEILILIPCIILHEIGHYIFYRLFGFKPTLKFNWWGITIGENVFHKLIPMQAYFVSSSGILFGMIPFFFVSSTNEVLYCYFLMCCVDLVIMFRTINIRKDWHKKSMLEIMELEIKEIKQDANNN